MGILTTLAVVGASIALSVPAQAASYPRSSITFSSSPVVYGVPAENGISVQTSKTVKVTFGGYSYLRVGEHYVAQLWTSTGHGWTDTGKRFTSASNATINITIPALSQSAKAKNATVRYRVKVPTTSTMNGDTSSVLTIHYVNVHRYTGLKRIAYKAVSKYCKAALISVSNLSGSEAGYYRTGTYTIHIDTSVARYSLTTQRSIAMHECGHYLQYKNYGGTYVGWTKMKKAAARVFKDGSIPPVEHMADCISHAIYPHGYLGYGGHCTAHQLHVARHVAHGGKI
jgi:hypothetical protein